MEVLGSKMERLQVMKSARGKFRVFEKMLAIFIFIELYLRQQPFVLTCVLFLCGQAYSPVRVCF